MDLHPLPPLYALDIRSNGVPFQLITWGVVQAGVCCVSFHRNKKPLAKGHVGQNLRNQTKDIDEFVRKNAATCIREIARGGVSSGVRRDWRYVGIIPTFDQGVPIDRLCEGSYPPFLGRFAIHQLYSMA